MAVPAARSLLHPYAAEEPLPLYTPRHPTATDPETSSINSSAPSYTSAAPSYHSAVPPSHRRSNDFSSASSSGNQNPSGGSRLAAPSSQQSGMLSSGGCAPGFQGYRRDSSRHNSSSGSFSSTNKLTSAHLHSLYNISEWVPVTEGLQARHYRNVAKRRVTEATNGTRPMFPMPAPTTSEPPTSGIGSSSLYSHGGGSGSNDVISTTSQRPSPSPVYGHGRGLPANTNSYSSSTPTLGVETEPVAGPSTTNNIEEETSQHGLPEMLPVSPHEDPDLVGEAAAARFRSQRLYMTAQQQQNLYQQPAISAGPTRPAPYSSLLPRENGTPTPTQSTDQLTRPSTSPNPFTGWVPPQSAAMPGTRTHERHRSATTAEEEEALRAQESKTWDFMLAQMADWEERERSWKRFKEEVDKRIGAGALRGQGLRFGLGGGGKGKLRKTQSGDPAAGGGGGGGGGRKWMSKVGFAMSRKEL